jgi:hypothetical protein
MNSAMTFSNSGSVVGNGFSGAGTLAVAGALDTGEGINLALPGGTVEVGGALTGTATYDVETTVFTGSGPQTIPSNFNFTYNNVTVTGDAVFQATEGFKDISGDLFVIGNGVADIGTAEVRVFGDMMADQSGVVRMVNDAALLEVHGNMVWHGISTAGALTAGEIHARGPLFEQHGTTSPQSFAPSGSHRTTFWPVADGQQTISFESPGPSESGFNNLGFDNDFMVGRTFRFISNAHVGGNVGLWGGDVSGSGVTVTIAGNLDDGESFCEGPCGDWLVDNTTFSGSPTLLPNFLDNNVTFTGNAALPGGLTVNGNLTVAGNGNLDLNGYSATVNGNVVTQNFGTLTMQDIADGLTILGDAIFAGGNTFNGPNCALPCLNAGQINLAGDLTQLGPEPQSFHVNEGGTTVNFNGTSATTQSISFANPAFSQSHLATMLISNVAAGVELTSDVYVYDYLQADGAGTKTIKGNGNTMVVGALSVSGATFDRVLLVWDRCPFGPPCPGFGFEVFGNVTFRGYNAADLRFDIQHSGQGSPFTMSNIMYDVQPNTDERLLRVTDPDTLDDLPLTINFNVNGATCASTNFEEIDATINWFCS